MRSLCLALSHLLEKFKDLPPLFFRLILAYGFLIPVIEKMKGFSGVVEWFGQLHIPFPMLSVIVVISTELIGVVCLTLGLFTRLVTIPLMFLLCVAVVKVHWVHGFDSAKNGFELPLYYLSMLFSLLIIGPGRISIDYFIKARWTEKN